MKSASTRAIFTRAAVAVTAMAPAFAADLPDVPQAPLTVSCDALGIPAAACTTDTITPDMIRAMLVAGPLTGPAMAPLMEAGVFGPYGALPPPPEVDAPAEGEQPPLFVPKFDVESYGAMLAAGVSRTVRVEDLGLEVTVPVIDCRFAICLPKGLTGGPGFVDWEEVEWPEATPAQGAYASE